jgi:hypothetical protein
MECEQIKKEYNIKVDCCDSCHEDNAEGFGNDLWFTIDGKDRNICCTIANYLLDRKESSE